VGLSLHANAWALLTSREVYWFLRGLPGRTVRDAQAVEEQERERRWFDARQKRAQAMVERRVQELRSEQRQPGGEETGGRDESGNVAALQRRAIRELAPALDLDMEAHAASLLAPSAASSGDAPSSAAANGGVVLVREFIPLRLSRPVPLSRRCDQAGIQDTLCVCNLP